MGLGVQMPPVTKPWTIRSGNYLMRELDGNSEYTINIYEQLPINYQTDKQERRKQTFRINKYGRNNGN